MPKVGDVILTTIPFTDDSGVKKRPALVLFQNLGNIVVAGITSNPEMKGIPITRAEGAIKDSVIKLNYIFTISEKRIIKILFYLDKSKKILVFNELIKLLSQLSA